MYIINEKKATLDLSTNLNKTFNHKNEELVESLEKVSSGYDKAYNYLMTN